MRREEAKLPINNSLGITITEVFKSVNEHIDNIYNELDAQICQNCRLVYISKEADAMPQCEIGVSNCKHNGKDCVELTFGCNEFEFVSTDTKGEEDERTLYRA